MAKDNEWIKVEGITQNDATMWEYENEDDTLSGVYKGRKENVGPNGSNIYYVETKDEGVKSFWSSALLDDRFKNIQEGDEVKLVYKGKQKSEKTGRSYHNFEVFYRKPW